MNKGHEIEDFDLDFKKREKQLKEIEKIFNEFNKVLIKLREEYDSICNIITKSFEIFKEKIVNYGKIRTRAILISQNSYKIDCFIDDFNNIINISKGKNIFDTFYSIIQLSEKISNKKLIEKIIDNKDKINIVNRNIDIKLFTKKNLQNKFIINKISNINFIRQKKYNDNNIIYEIKDFKFEGIKKVNNYIIMNEIKDYKFEGIKKVNNYVIMNEIIDFKYAGIKKANNDIIINKITNLKFIGKKKISNNNIIINKIMDFKLYGKKKNNNNNI